MPYVSRDQLRLTEAEAEGFLGANRWGRLATASLDAQPHVTPIGYVFHNGAIWFHGLRRSRRGRNLSANPKVAFLVDDGLNGPYTNRRGVIVYGRCVLADGDPELNGARQAFMRAFDVTSVAQVERRTHAWYRIDVERTSSWDFRKIPAGSDRNA